MTLGEVLKLALAVVGEKWARARAERKWATYVKARRRVADTLPSKRRLEALAALDAEVVARREARG